MSDEKTPTQRTLRNLFATRKRGPPSTGSSTEGTTSKVTKKISLEKEMENQDIQKDLLRELEDGTEDTMAECVILGDFEKHIEKCFKEFKVQIREQLKQVVSKMNDKIKVLEARVEVCEKELALAAERSEQICPKEIEQIKVELNRQAQYSRKDNLRIFGKAESKDEDCKQVVCDLIKNSLKVKIVPSDISAAHRLPKSGKQKHPPIIIRLKDRSQRQEILKVRKLLKGSGISVSEDMTRENVQLVKDAEVSGYFTSVWFANGKVKAADGKNNKYTLNIFDNFPEIAKKPGRRV